MERVHPIYREPVPDTVRTAAQDFREAEADYFSTMYAIMALEEDPDRIRSRRVIDPVLQFSYMNASDLYHEMLGYIKKHGFIIGGKNGKYRIGEVHTYDPAFHEFKMPPQLSYPQLGQEVMVCGSEVATKDHLILPVQVTSPLLNINSYQHLSEMETLPRSSEIFRR